MALRTVLSVVFATLLSGVTATERLVVAAGCFWSVELAYQRVPGVISTSVGYCGGIGDNPTYEQVSRGNTMHAEAVEIVYDEKVVSARTLIDLLWQIHDPTTLNRQGGDRGTQYRSHVWYTTDAQRAAFEASKAAYEATMSSFSGAIVTKLDSAQGRAVLEGGGLPPAISAEGRPGRDEGQPQANPVLRTARPDQEDGQGGDQEDPPQGGVVILVSNFLRPT